MKWDKHRENKSYLVVYTAYQLAYQLKRPDEGLRIVVGHTLMFKQCLAYHSENKQNIQGICNFMGMTTLYFTE